MGNGFLQDIETVIQREQGVFAESHNQRLFFGAQNGRVGLFRTHRRILHLASLLPLGDGLRVEAILLCQASYARLTCLNCATDCRCRSGAAVEYLYHNCSFCTVETVPLYSGTIHLMTSGQVAERRTLKTESDGPYFSR